MTSAIQFPVFEGARSKGAEQFWFVVRVVWEAHEVTNDNIKKATLVSALQDRMLKWYKKYSNDHPNAGTVEIRAKLKKEFIRPKLETQSIIRFKEIAMLPGETHGIWIKD